MGMDHVHLSHPILQPGSNKGLAVAARPLPAKCLMQTEAYSSFTPSTKALSLRLREG
jgi:hypothetical protein